MNEVTLVGKIYSINESNITIKTNTYDADNTIRNDYLDITLSDELLKNVSTYCKINDTVGVKAYIKRNNINDKMVLIARKVTFLSSARKA